MRSPIGFGGVVTNTGAANVLVTIIKVEAEVLSD